MNKEKRGSYVFKGKYTEVWAGSFPLELNITASHSAHMNMNGKIISFYTVFYKKFHTLEHKSFLE